MKTHRMVIFVMSLLCMASTATSQNLIGPNWKFHTGDSSVWANPGFDDSGWKSIESGKVWELQGYDGYDGFAWYRTSAVIPSKLKKEAERQGGFLLRLGKIDDADVTYFNGEEIGKTGDLPPNYVCMYDAERGYLVPSDKMKWDQSNVIAVRVFDNGGNGGLWGAPAEFTVKGFADQFQIGVAFKDQDHVFTNQKNLVIPIVFQNSSRETQSGKIMLEIKSDFGDSISNQSRAVKIKKQSEKTFEFGVSDLKPGFYSGLARFESPSLVKQQRFAFGIDPEKVTSPPDRQPDFDRYWERAKKELAAVDPQFNMIRQDSLCTPKRDIYLVEMRSLQNVLVRGWYTVPKKPGKYPAILHVQGYSTNMQPGMMVQNDDFASFGINIRGHGNSRDDVNPGFPGYLLDHLNDRECYIYRGAYMDCLRALDFLLSRPEVDADRIVVEGGSQGGALSFATAALAPDRVRLCVPSVPFLSDFRHYFKVASWPGNEYALYVEKHPEITWEQVYTTLSYIDIKNLAPWIKAPVLMSVGLMDETCPPHINFAAYNNLTSPKAYIAYPFSGHGLPGTNYAVRMAWIRKQLGMN